MARHAAGNGVNGEFHRDAPLCELVVQLPHAVLGLRDGHSVAGNDHHRETPARGYAAASIVSGL